MSFFCLNKKTKISFFAFLFLIFSGISTFGVDNAKASPPVVLDLEKCIEIALEKNLALLQAGLGVNSTQALARATLKEMLPTVSTQYSYTGRRDANSITIFGRSTRISSHDNYSWNVILAQPIFKGGALWNRFKVAKLDVNLTEKELERVESDIIRLVKETYYTLLKAEKIEEEMAASVKRLESHLRVAKGFYDVGLIAKNELLQSEVELAEARQNLISARHNVAISKAKLNKILRRNLEEDVRLAGKLIYEPYKADLATLQEKAQRMRPEIQAGLLAVKKSRRELETVRANFFPQIDLVANYEKRGITPDVSDNPFGDHDMAQLSLQASWELWAWGKTRDRVKAAATDVARARLALQEVRDNVAIEVKEAWLRLIEAREVIKVAKRGVDQAEENFRLNTERYREHLATSTDVLDAEALLTKARTRYFNAIADHLIAKARLMYAVGEKN